MEKNGRITLIDKELSEKQQSLSRYIEHYTRIPFSGQTYSEWQMWVGMNKPYADDMKAQENEQKADEKPVKKYKNRDRKRGREIAVDCAKLYGAIKSIGETNGHICALCGFGHAYLSDVKRRGWMYESDIAKLSDAGIDAADYVTDEWYRAKYLTEDEPATEQSEEVPENCVQFNALGVRFKDNTEAQEFATILQILGMTERDFTTAAFFALFDRFKAMTVPALLRVREKRIDRIAQGETGGKLRGTEASATILDEMAAEDADNAD